jgi:hypothetical protein
MKNKIINIKTGREIQENQWVSRKDIKGFYSRYEVLEIYEDDDTARVRVLTGDDGYLYTTQPFHKLGLRKVLL